MRSDTMTSMNSSTNGVMVTQSEADSLRNEISLDGQGTTVAIPRSIPTSYNEKFTVKLKYVDQYKLNPTQTGNIAQTWAVNDLWDPDFTNVGHQPYFRDPWASMYTHYTVLNCEIKLYMANCTTTLFTETAGGTNTFRIPLVVSLKHGTNTTGFGADVPFPRLEQNNTINIHIFPEFEKQITLNYGPGDFQMDNNDADVERTWTPVGQSPNIRKYFQLLAASGFKGGITGLSPTQYHTLMVTAELTYTVQFNDINMTLRNASS